MDRITLYTDNNVAGAEGYDIVSGSTEYCIKHYIANNLTAATNENRNIYGLEIAPNLDRGKADDSNMTAFDVLSDFIYTMCDNAEIGYDITADLTANKYVFDVREKCDKSIEQNERNCVVFAKTRGNVVEMVREVGITADKNTLYVQWDNITTLVNRDEAQVTELVGLDRRETYLQVTCEERDKVPAYARKNADNYVMTDSLTVTAGNVDDYGLFYELGDIVTVIDRERNLELNSVISEVIKSFSGGKYNLEIVLGDTKPSTLSAVNNTAKQAAKGTKDNNINGGNQAYTTGIDFHDGGFDLTFTRNAVSYTNTFTVTEDAQNRITAITNTTAGRTIEVTYDD